MKRLKNLTRMEVKLKPTFFTFKFELGIQKSKFIIFSLITVLISFLTGFLPYYLNFQNLHWELFYFYSSSLMFFIFMLAFSSTFFFSGIICSEHKKKTGFTILPLLKRHELLIGKFFANYLLSVGVAAVQYISMVLYGFYFYGPPLLSTPILSFGLVMVYLLALNSIITFFSSFMPSATSVIIVVLSLFFFGFAIIQSLLLSVNPYFEPLYSFYYLFNIIQESLNPLLLYNYQHRYFIDPEMNDVWWGFPTIEGALISLTIYFVVFFLLSYLIFKKKGI